MKGVFLLNVIKGKISVLGYEVQTQTNSVPVYSSVDTGILKLSEAGGYRTAKLSKECADYIRDVFKENARAVLDAVDASSSAALILKTESWRFSIATTTRFYRHIFYVSPKV